MDAAASLSGPGAVSSGDKVVQRIESVEDLRKLADALEQLGVTEITAKAVYKNPKRIRRI
jgi:hypothetical protein